MRTAPRAHAARRVRWPAALPDRAVVALARRSTTALAGARLGLASTVATVAVSLVAASVLARADPDSDWQQLGITTMRWVLWLGVGPLVASIAGPVAERDRTGGVLALAALRGHPPRRLADARVLAAAWIVTSRVGWSALGWCVALAWLVPTHALSQLVRAVGLVLFALVAGMSLGVVAALCSRYALRRGRSVLAAVVLVPWLVGQPLGRTHWSIPGALDRALVVAADVTWLVPEER